MTRHTARAARANPKFPGAGKMTAEHRTLILHGHSVRVSHSGAISAEDLRPVISAVMAGKYPSPAEVEAFSAWTRGAIPSPQWDEATIIVSEAA